MCEEKRDSFIFYRSFFEAIDGVEDDKLELEYYRAILYYGLEGNFKEEPKGMLKRFLALIIPQLEANNKKRRDGQKGGRKPKNQTLENKKPVVFENENQWLKNKKPNVNVNVNENVNANENENVNDNVSFSFQEEISDEQLKEELEKEMTKTKKKQNKKMDLYNNPYAETFKKTYKKITGNNCYLDRKHLERLSELSEMIPDLEETFEPVLKKMKEINFGFEGFVTNINWLFKDQNYTAILNGQYDGNTTAKSGYDKYLEENYTVDENGQLISKGG